MNVRFPVRPLVVRSGFGGLACLDIVWRSLPELVGLGDSLVLPAMLALSTGVVLDAGTVGWVLGWFLLASLVAYVAPRLYPESAQGVASGVPMRLAVAGSTVAVGTLIERTIVEEWFGVGTTPIPYGLERLGAILAASAGAFAVAMALGYLSSRIRGGRGRADPNSPAGSRGSGAGSSVGSSGIRTDRATGGADLLNYSFDSSGGSSPTSSPSLRDHHERGVTATVSPGPVSLVAVSVLLCGFLGLLLSGVSLLYPLPELVVVGWFVRDTAIEVLDLTHGQIPVRLDVAERFAMGASAVWAGVRGVLTFVYVCSGLFLTIIYVLYVRQLVGDVFGSGLVPGMFLVACLGTATLHAAVYWLRIVDRLPAHLFADDETAPVGRVPGLLIPSGLLVGLFAAWSFSGSGEGLPETVSLGYAIPAVVLVAVALRAVLRRDHAVESAESDALAVPLAFGMLAALPPSIGNETVGEGLHALFADGTFSVGVPLYALAVFLAVGVVAVVPYFSPAILATALENEFGGFVGLLGTYTLTLLASLVTFGVVSVVGAEAAQSNPVTQGLLVVMLLLMGVSVLHTGSYVANKVG